MIRNGDRKKPWLRAAVLGTASILLLATALIAYANYAYHRVPPADLPCRQCTGEARAVSIGGFDLFYRELGPADDPAPVVLLHGGPGHSSLSFKQGFDFLAPDRRVVYYDQRGSGNSQIRPDPSLYTIEQLVEELDGLRRDILRAEKIVLVGHSAGGALAQRYALAHPDRVERMILVGSIRINNGIGIPLLWDVFGPLLYAAGPGLPPADPQAADAWFAGLLLATSLPRLHDPAKRSLIEDSGYVSFATWREVSRSLGGTDYTAALQELYVKTLVLYGSADADATGKTAAEAICGLLPDCLLAGFDRSGHWPFLEEPESFQSTVLSFLSE
ncbi:MAG: alpha/beta hydrolase [Anaerolineales bacterium]|nr:alpha/beta hydrolase [Anaerolineales bacterium]